jgi:hypothetical protein
VFIQPQGPSRGTYVETGTTGFDVIEQDGGSSSLSFSYRVVAKRKGLETERLEVCAAGFGDPLLYPELRGTTQLEQFRHMCIMTGNAHLFDELTARAEKDRAESEASASEEQRHRHDAVPAFDSVEASEGSDLESRDRAAESLRLLLSNAGRGSRSAELKADN